MNPTRTRTPSRPLPWSLLPLVLGLFVLVASCSDSAPAPFASETPSPVFHHNPGHGGGPGGDDGGGTPDTTITVRITTSIAGSGLYGEPDSLFVYDGRFGGDGIRVGADCPEQMVLDLSGQSDAFGWPMESPSDEACARKNPNSFARITIPEFDPASLTVGEVIGADPDIMAGETNLCCVLNYYFGDNVVWKGGIRVVAVEDPDANTRVVRLSTIPDQSPAELWDRDKGTTFKLADVTAHFELEVTVVIGP